MTEQPEGSAEELGSGPTSPSRSRLQRLIHVSSHPSWQGFAGVIGLFALFVAIATPLIASGGDDKDKNAAKINGSTPPPSAVTATPTASAASDQLSAIVYHETNDDDDLLGDMVFNKKIILTPSDQESIKENGLLAWSQGHEGYDHGATGIKLTLKAISEVRILNMRAKIITRTSPLTGTLFEYPWLPQGGDPSLRIRLDLEDPSPVAQEVDEFGRTTGKPYFKTKSFIISEQKSKVFEIEARLTAKFASTWKIEISYIADGKLQKLEIGDSDGSPFRTTAYASDYQISYTRCLAPDDQAIQPTCAGKPIHSWALLTPLTMSRG